MMKTKFSRDRITEFVKDLSREATQIIISVTGEKDRALVFLPFSSTALVVYGEQSVVSKHVFGEVIPGSVPERHVLTVE